MPSLRVVILWHQHQPFYKDLVSGQYRLPWVRMHALKDYYGMVKLLDEFPKVHQTFNLVPSLVTQIQDYAAGTASDPFLEVAAKPAGELTTAEKRFALTYLFQANHHNMIGRYPRYRELLERMRGVLNEPNPESFFQRQDFTDLQVLSQLAWFDEFFLEQREVLDLVRKGRDYSLEDQSFVISLERELIGRVLPAHAEASRKGSVEISTSPFYHPILPLVCDTNAGAASTAGLPLPQNRFRHPEDARDQILRGMDLHESVFGSRPRGLWPSEGSVSEEAIQIAHSLGIHWMATDEGVLGRSLGVHFGRDGNGGLPGDLAARLYNIHRFERDDAAMHMVFRDHSISDLIGFVYSGMPPAEAANHLMGSIRRAAEPVLSSGRDAVVSIILDGENAWEYFPKSGREFLRRFYDRLQNDPGVEALTVSEAIARHEDFHHLSSITPGSWINANFNVWIGAPEDNMAWDYLYKAREFYSDPPPGVDEAKRRLAYEELLIAEGSDWNWWYGPEHHSSNDSDFDELYRKHLANVYQLLGATPPEYLLQPITIQQMQPRYQRQTAFIHPSITGALIRYFEWMGAASLVSDERSSAMHGKKFLLKAMYAGVDEDYVYGRLDFAGTAFSECDVTVAFEHSADGRSITSQGRLEVSIAESRPQTWSFRSGPEMQVTARPGDSLDGVIAALGRAFEFRLPLRMVAAPMHGVLRLRFTLWKNRLPLDSLPQEGWLELQLVSEEEMLALAP